MTIVITSCTNRKKGLVHPGLNQSELRPGSIDSVANQWIRKLKKANVRVPAREVYCGRGFREAEATSQYLSCPLFVVSAGLGIINSDIAAPIYDLSVSSSSGDSVLTKISGKISPRVWWSHISSNNPFGTSLNTLLSNHPDGLILIALSRTYLDLVQEELAQCPPSQQSRLRFFGKILPSTLPSHLINNWMPYDDRLDGIGREFGGTQADFAQRALRHFASKVLGKSGGADIKKHRAMVLKALSHVTPRERPNRQRLTDPQISKTIRKNWKKGKGQSNLLLRIIRDDLNIACEQKRFTKIYYSVKAELGDTA